MDERPISDAIKARLAALVFSPAIPIAWPGRNFTPDGSRFLSAQISRVPNERLTTGQWHRYSGVLLVGVCIPSGDGTGAAEGVADAVARQFPCDLRLTLSNGAKLRVTAKPTLRDGFLDGPYWRVPVTIPFEVLSD